MLRQFPFLSRFYSKLLYEMLPGAIISALGGILLNQYYVRPPAAVTVAAPVSAEIVQAMHNEQTRLIDYLAKNGEARPQAAAAPLDSAELKPAEPAVAVLATKPAGTKTARAEKPEKRVASKPRQEPPVGPPLQLAQMANGASPVQPAPPVAAPRDDNMLVAKLRDVTATVQHIPARIRSAVTWSFDDFPPRPPAPVMGQNFLKASM